MFALLADPNTWASLATLTLMEIILGVDNIVFISVLVSKLPESQARLARQIGLSMALVFRILLLLVLSWLIGLTNPLFELLGHAYSWRDIILFVGGAFLIYKATSEIHEEIEDPHDPSADDMVGMALSAIVAQIVVIDAVFSIDSIVTAIGMAQHVEVMIAAVIIAVGIMYAASAPISDFIGRHPTTKMLALAFLILIGVSLVADAIGFHIPKGYIYAAMLFSVVVEAINITASARRKARNAGKEHS
ncbi:MAG: TerC family protein [Hyphomicrobiaceae bacterium]|nr:TerC family protein [Hyphomicrobiaceae bacterium]